MMEKFVLLHLSLINGIGPATIKKIFSKNLPNKKEPHSKLYDYKENDFLHEYEISPRTAKLIVDGLSNKKLLDEELFLIDKHKINTISFFDEDYPEELKEIFAPPPILYCIGKAIPTNNNIKKRLAIVGSRKADFYAKKTLEIVIPKLVEHDYAIVSGGALGVDSTAHEQTIKHGGKTIAVLGSGLMNPYPKTNLGLFRSITQNGALISPFPLKTSPCKGNFPARNRIISGLSQGCLVVQAAKKSGALITAHFALDQGRQVFAIPGSIHNFLSAGCHELIKQGAKLVANTNDILEEFGEKAYKKKESFPSPENNNILQYFDEPISIDELSEKTGICLQKLQDELFSLQLEGKIKQNFTGLWEQT